MEKYIFIILENYYNKNGKLPADGRMLVAKNVAKNGDLLDYMLESKNGNVRVTYNYYEDASNEKKFISSIFNLKHVS